MTSLPLTGFSVTVKVRFAEPLSPSATLGEPMESDGAPSSSVIVSVTSAGCVIPCVFAAVPETVTLLSASSMVLSTAVTVTVPLLLVAPAAIVNFALPLSEKSPATAPVPAAADTVIVVSSLEGWSSEAVTVVEFVAPLSGMLVRESARVTVGASSSSVIVPVPLAVPIPAFPAPLNATTTVSSGSSVVSPVTDTVIVSLVSPAVKVSVPPVTAV